MGQGTGLGLSTVYGIVKQSGGYVFAMPNPQTHGTQFSIYLPAMPKPAAAAPPPPPNPQRDHAHLVGLNVLLVEDDDAIRNIFERALKNRGLIVTAAASADPALEALESAAHFDVLVSDIMMPGVDGVELARRARLMRPGLVTVLVSGYAEMPLHRAVDAQGINFLSKPFSLAELMDAIAEVILSNSEK
jgi:two-component system cell cycle sensor histidine kinase/response regulator CckA